MNQIFYFLLVAGTLILTSCSSMKKSAAPTPPKPDIQNLSARKYSANVRADYVLFLPKDYDAKSGKRWPTIVFLHGSGERGSNVWRAIFHGPTKFIEKHPDFP
ncbi:MAG TPA: phospholipase, partial [Verrucomicrobiae bacterium]|nr:phospholipase [Verrucomicrobiae bacterium]